MIAFFLSYFLVYQYIVLFFVVLAASFGFPLPATMLLMAAGAFAAQWYLRIEDIWLCGIIACVAGDVLSYSLSYRYGRKLLFQIGLKNILLSSKFETIEGIFQKYTIASIFLSRFLFIHVGPIINVMAGLSKTSPKKFLIFDLLGEIIYVLIFSGLGYAFSDEWRMISSLAGDITSVLVLILVFVVLLAVFLLKKQNTRKKRVFPVFKKQSSGLI